MTDCINSIKKSKYSSGGGEPWRRAALGCPAGGPHGGRPKADPCFVISKRGARDDKQYI